MNPKVRVAVLGVGSLGKEHARLYAELARAGAVEFAGIFDVNAEAARQHASRHGVPAFSSVAEAAAAADALSVVTPTVTHYAIARELLEEVRVALFGEATAAAGDTKQGGEDRTHVHPVIGDHAFVAAIVTAVLH